MPHSLFSDKCFWKIYPAAYEGPVGGHYNRPCPVELFQARGPEPTFKSYFRREGCCCKCWSVCMWIDNWKKGILYIALSIPVFLEGMRIILGVVSGFLLIICGCLYIVKTFKDGIVYTVTETRYVKTYTPSVHTVSHTVSTQTEDDKYYAEVQSTEWGTESPSVTQREQFTH